MLPAVYKSSNDSYGELIESLDDAGRKAARGQVVKWTPVLLISLLTVRFLVDRFGRV